MSESESQTVSTLSDEGLVVLRHGETFLKGANRRFFEKVLFGNTEAALKDLPGVRLSRAQGRFFVHCPRAISSIVVRRLGEVFGYSSLSPARPAPAELGSISAAARGLVAELNETREIASFRVATRRSDKRFPLPSPEVSREVGAVIFMEFGIPVDLYTPEMVVGVEIGERQTFVYVERVPGAGGLPVGVSGRVMLLLSGGIDSPVAGHLLQKRGAELDAVYFHAPPHTSERARDKVEQLATRLAQRQRTLRLHVVNFTAVQQRLRDHGPSELAVVLYRRAMARIASKLALRAGCQALISGDNLGQVASQTLENLACVEDAAEMPLLRPLLGYDKSQIIELAQAIGTYETSILPHEDTCSLFVPKHPATKAQVARVRQCEELIDMGDTIKRAIETVDIVRLPPRP